MDYCVNSLWTIKNKGYEKFECYLDDGSSFCDEYCICVRTVRS